MLSLILVMGSQIFFIIPISRKNGGSFWLRIQMLILSMTNSFNLYKVLSCGHSVGRPDDWRVLDSFFMVHNGPMVLMQLINNFETGLVWKWRHAVSIALSMYHYFSRLYQFVFNRKKVGGVQTLHRAMLNVSFSSSSMFSLGLIAIYTLHRFNFIDDRVRWPPRDFFP